MERTYRRALRLLPAAYRQRWQDDMVSTLLDAEQDAAAAAVAGEGPERQAEEREIALLQRPPAREVAGVLALAVRLHLAAPDTPGASEAGRLWGSSVRRVALLGLLCAAAVELVAATSILLGPALESMPASDVWASVALSLTWVAAFVLLATGRAKAATVVTLLALAPQLWPQFQALVRFELSSPVLILSELASLLLAFVRVVALVAWRSDAPRPSGRWLLALPLVAAAYVGLWWPWRWGVFLVWDDVAVLCLTSAVVAGVAVTRADRSWMRTAWLLAGVCLLARALTWATLPSLPGHILATSVVAAAQLALAASVLGVAAAWHLRDARRAAVGSATTRPLT